MSAPLTHLTNLHDDSHPAFLLLLGVWHDAHYCLMSWFLAVGYCTFSIAVFCVYNFLVVVEHTIVTSCSLGLFFQVKSQVLLCVGCYAIVIYLFYCE